MRKWVQHLLLFLAAALIFGAACSRKTEKPKASYKPIESGAGTIAAAPNPIQVCDGSGMGVTRLTWTVTRPTTKRVEVHGNAPDGPLFSHTLGPGSADTVKWVGDGTVFFLQDVTNSLPLIEENTLATVRVNITTAGCR